MKYIFLILFMGFVFTADAQVEFTVKISKDAVMIGEPFILEYEVNRNFDNFKLPEFENFKLISGPNTSMQQNINMVNGEMTKKISVKYSYVVKALKHGNQSMQSAEIKIGTEYFNSDTVTIIVIDSEYRDPKENKGKDIKGTEKI